MEEIVADAAHSGAHIFRTPTKVSKTGREGTTPWDKKTAVATARLTSPVQSYHSTTDFPSRNRNQEIINLIRTVSLQWIRNAEKLKTSINGFFAEDRFLTPNFSKVVGCKFTDESSVDVNSCCGTNFRSNAVFIPNTNFINLGITSINTTN